MLELTSDTENDETQTSEEIVEGVVTDTSDADEAIVNEPEKEEVKTFTQDEVNEIVKSRLARMEREHERELSKYKDTENVLRKTLNVSDGEDVNTALRNYYKEEGIELPEVYQPGLTPREINALAKDDADLIMAEGQEAMVKEAHRLANKGYENLSQREKAVFTTLSNKISEEKAIADLKKLGASEELIKDSDFIEFKNQFNTNVPIEKIYSLYKGNQPKPKVENPGSMKSSQKTDVIKDFYTYEEASKFTREDLDRNPKLVQAIENSMTKW